MKRIHSALSRLGRKFIPRRGKKGSSLAFVMMVGAVLVIWVMCIMPLMTTTGQTAAQTQSDLSDYVDSRSAIEYCKSELQYMVDNSGLPKTFAVITQSDGTYTAISKKDSAGFASTDYPTYITNGTTDDKDVPNDTSGNAVAAICSVVNNNPYEITIRTFHEGEEGMTYTVDFTASGSLLIHPEAYKQNQALPLSDFVLVDGKLGSNQVWESSITMSNAEDLNFTETLKPYLDTSHENWYEGYADAGEYPAVFKTTAYAATANGETPLTKLTMGELSSDVEWTMPKAGDNAELGNMRYLSGENKVQLYTGEKWEDVSCTIYYNGATGNQPTTGLYTVCVDFSGYAREEDTENGIDGVHILPVSGLVLGNFGNSVKDGEKQPLEETVSIAKIEAEKDDNDKSTGKYTITFRVKKGDTVLEGDDLPKDLLYAYCTDKTTQENGNKLDWVNEPKITGVELDSSKTYYFFVCRPGTYENGVYRPDSDIKSAGTLYPMSFVTSLDSGSNYVMVQERKRGDSETKSYYALNQDKDLTFTQITTEYGFLTDTTMSSLPCWTYEFKSEGSWPLTNTYKMLSCGEKYLGLNGKRTGNWYDQKWTCEVLFENLNTFQNNEYQLSIRFDGQKASVFRTVSNKKICLSFENEEYSTEEKAFATTNSDDYSIRFMKLPTSNIGTDKILSPSQTGNNTAISVEYGTSLSGMLDGKGFGSIQSVYVNGTNITNLNVKLNAGTYDLIVVHEKNGYTLHTHLSNKATVTKQTRSDEFVVTVTAPTQKDELLVTVTADGWHDYGGIHYFAYKDAENNKDTWHWLSTTDNSFSFRLNYGSYYFKVKESGSVNYQGVEWNLNTETITISPTYVELKEDERVLWSFDTDDKTMPVWYRLPQNILPDRVKLVYKYTSKYGTSTIWLDKYIESSFDYSIYEYSFANSYGIVVTNSNYKWENGKYSRFLEANIFDSVNVFPISDPLPIGGNAQYAPSMISGSSLYFMDSVESIYSGGATVYLTADLLVLNAQIDNGQIEGQIIVKPYTRNRVEENKYTLLFNSGSDDIQLNELVTLESHCFYRVEPGTDLKAATSDTVKYLCKYRDESEEFQTIQRLMRQDIFPELNLDIAYASKEQLSHIVSSETLGWTVDGKLAGSDTNQYTKYAVPTYVSEINGDVNYTANRILIACNGGLKISSDLTFTTRYLSLDAASIEGAETSHFWLYNLGQNASFIQKLSNALSLTGYCSRTLQVDYEQATLVTHGTTAFQIKSQICRYDDETDLLESPDATLELTAEYTTEEINNLFENQFSATVKTVDRYIALRAPEGTDGSIKVWAVLQAELDIYANYIYIDDSVKTIELTGWLVGSDLKVNSQESGYTQEEYLGYYTKNTGEIYSGTLIYLKDYLDLITDKTYRLEPGFYLIPAATDGSKGTSLTKLTETEIKDGQTVYKYKVDPNSLKDYSIYIKPDGSLSNAYVDTGIYDSNNINSTGGFSGGTIK